MTKMPSRPKLMSLPRRSARRVPDADAVAARAHLQIVPALDPVVADDRGRCAPEVDSDQVVLEAIALDHSTCAAGGHEDAAVHRRKIAAGAGDGKPAHDAPGRVDGDHAARPHRRRAPHPARPRASRRDRRRSAQHGARRPAPDDRRPPRRRWPPPACRRWAATATVAARAAVAHDKTTSATPQPIGALSDHVRQTLVGSTNIRPFISMCMAWQNHWQ